MAGTDAHRSDRVALNGDVVSYSRLLADDYDGTMAALEGHRLIIERRLADHRGTMANFVGDSFMAVFDDPRDAVQAAIGITTDIEAANADVPDSRRVRFRLGIDQGDVGVLEGRYHGDALNIAARIQAIARPGGLSVSGRVYRALDEPSLRFHPTGRQDLKNIPERVEVYELVGLPTEPDHSASRRSLELEAPTIAVLPIHIEGTDDPTAAAARLIRSDLIHRLAQVPLLNVVDSGPDPGAAGPGSVARYMLETGVHQFGDRIRVFSTLFDVTTMNPVKSHKWTATSDELFDLSDRISDEVARAVEVELIVGEPAGLYAELGDPESIERVYLGWYHLRSDTPEGWQRALELFESVARAHPDHAYGHVLTAFTLWLGASNGWTSDVPKALADAREIARRGRDAGDPTGMAQAVEAAILMAEGRVDEALVEMDQLEIVRPTCDITYGLEGSIRRYLGEWERAVELLDTAMRLTGINKPWYPTVKASSLFVGGRVEEAAALAQGVVEYQPGNLEALLVLAASQAELGLERRARATADLIRERFPSVDAAAWLDAAPYHRREVIERWKDDLTSSGLIASG